VDTGEAPPPRLGLIAGVLFEALLVGLAFGFGAMFGIRPLETLRFDPTAAALGVAATVPLLALFLVFLKSRAKPFVKIRAQLDAHLLPIFRAASIVDLFSISAIAGIGEELLFRGVVQVAVGAYAGPVAGLVVGAVLFGLAHSITKTYTVVAALLGVWLGGLWLFTGDLVAPIVAHALYDFVALLLYVRDARRRGVT
jgi:membrane protease YdiL (CAAX protease family)